MELRNLTLPRLDGRGRVFGFCTRLKDELGDAVLIAHGLSACIRKIAGR